MAQAHTMSPARIVREIGEFEVVNIGQRRHQGEERKEDQPQERECARLIQPRSHGARAPVKTDNGDQAGAVGFKAACNGGAMEGGRSRLSFTDSGPRTATTRAHEQGNTGATEDLSKKKVEGFGAG